MKKHRLRKALLILAGVLMVLYVIACNILVSAALVPSFMEKLEAFEALTEKGMSQQVYTEDIVENQAQAADETEEWVRTADSQLLTVTTDDGYELAARVFYQEEESHKWVLLLHGYTGWKEEMYPLGFRYAGQGYQVLAPDMRCSGESGGDYIGMGWTDRLDNMLWLEWILEQDPQAQIVIHGQSMGAACALMMSGEESLPGAVKAIVADSAYTNAYDMFKKQMWDWARLPSFPLLPGADLMLRLRAGYSLKDADALEAVKKTKLPVLFIHGTEDAFVPASMSSELYEAAAGPRELLLVEGSGHVQAQDKNPELYYGTVFRFLETYGMD